MLPEELGDSSPFSIKTQHFMAGEGILLFYQN